MVGHLNKYIVSIASTYNIYRAKWADLCGNIKDQKWNYTKTAKRISGLQQASK
jgi:hypothetical protein